MPDQKLQQIVERMVAGGESEEDIAAVIQHYQTQAPVQQTSAEPKSLLDAIPSALAAGMSFATGKAPLLSTLAAGFGGAYGAGARDLGKLAQDPVAEGPGWEAFKRLAGQAAQIPGAMLREGAEQAALEAAGAGLSKGLGYVGKQAYRGALRPSAAVRLKTPQVVEQGLKDAAVVGPQSSVAKIRGLAKASKGEADTLVAKASPNAPPVSRREVRQPLVGMAQDSRRAARQTGLPDETSVIAERARKLQPSYTTQEAHESARILNDAADKAFRAEQRGGQIAGAQDRINRELASSFSNSVKARVPGLADVNRQTMNRMGLAKALKDAAERPSVLANIASGGIGASTAYGTGDISDGIAAGLAVRGLGSPRALSMTGIGLDRAARVPFANLFRAALLAQMGLDESAVANDQ